MGNLKLVFTGWIVLQFGDESESLAEPGLEMLRGSETLELAIDHDGQSGAEVLALLHRV